MLYRDLDVYKVSLQLAIDTHKITTAFPKGAGFALGDQMRRAALSIPCNISEGAMRNSSKEFIQYVAIARGSCAELRTQISVAEGVGYVNGGSDPLIRTERIRQMLTSLMNSLRKQSG